MTPVLAGPLEVPPPVTSAEADAMLDEALTDVQLGAWDREVLSWMRASHPGEQAVVASWVWQGWQAGVEVGRRECADEAAASHRPKGGGA